MSDNDIKFLLMLTQEHAKELMEQGRWSEYKKYRNDIHQMINEFVFELPLRTLQFFYCDKSPYNEDIIKQLSVR